jgi:hypothetical protein
VGLVKVIGPDGVERYVKDTELGSLGEGYKIDPDQQVGIGISGGRTIQTQGSYLESKLGAEGYVPIQSAAEAMEQRYADIEAEEYGGTFGDELTAFGIGAAGGLTFGLSDLALEGLGVDTEAYAEHNPWASGLGEAGGIAAGTLLSGGTGGLGTVVRATPAGALSAATRKMGSTSTKAFIAAEALEGSAYGLGQGLSNLAVTDEPLTADLITSELLQGGLLGAAFGAGGAGVLKGVPAGYRAVKGLKTPKTSPLLDVTTPEGAEFLGTTSRHISRSMDLGDELLAKTDLTPLSRVTPEETADFAQWGKYLDASADDVYARAAARRAELDAIPRAVGPSKEAIGQEITRLEEELVSMPSWFAKGPKGPRPSKHAEYLKGELKKARASLKAAPTEAQVTSRQDVDDLIAGLDAEVKALRKIGPAGDAFKGKEFAGYPQVESISNLRRMLGDSADDIEALAMDHKTVSTLGEEIAARISKEIPPDLVLARDRLAQAHKAMSEAGDFTPHSIGKALGGSPEDILKLHGRANDYFVAMENLAKVSGDRTFMKQTNEVVQDLFGYLDGALPSEAVDAAKRIGLNDMLAQVGGQAVVESLGIDGPMDNIAAIALVAALSRKGKLGTGVAEATGAVAKKGKIGGALEYMTGRGVSSAVGGAMKGSGLPTRAMRGVLHAAGYKAGSGAMNKILSPGGLFQASGRATGEIAHAVKRMLRGTAKTAAKGSIGAVATLKGLKLREESRERTKQREGELAELFKQKSKALLRLSADPHRLAMTAHELTAPLRMQHSTLGDKAEVGLTRAVQYMVDKMPKDPGTVHMMGVSTWQPSDLQISEWANHVRGVMFPASVIEGVIDGSISPQGAEALRAVYPERFAALQRAMAENAVELQKKLTYDQQVRVGVLMGVPVNSVTDPEYMQFVVGQYTQRQSEQEKATSAVDGNALLNNQPTKAQKLQDRGR